MGGIQGGDSFPTASYQVVLSAQTAATGTNYTAFASQECYGLVLVNNSGTTVEVRYNGAGVAIPVFTSNYYLFVGITNANQLSVRRVDTSNTQVTVVGQCLIP